MTQTEIETCEGQVPGDAPRSVTLDELIEELARLVDAIEGGEGELDDEQAWQLDLNDEQRKKKVCATIEVIETCKARAKANQALAAKYAAKAKAAENAAERIEARLRSALLRLEEVAGEAKVKGDTYTAWIQDYECVDGSDANLDMLPPFVVETKRSLKKAEAKKLLKQNVVLLGVKLETSRKLRYR